MLLEYKVTIIVSYDLNIIPKKSIIKCLLR